MLSKKRQPKMALSIVPSATRSALLATGSRINLDSRANSPGGRIMSDESVFSPESVENVSLSSKKQPNQGHNAYNIFVFVLTAFNLLKIFVNLSDTTKQLLHDSLPL